ncbi:response regulator transcription factor [Engelhardtia mirabilis]|uniref:Phosphate regulon transcriptional regulatory protein PhoB n=1 Tax=Engelhardtia mirabilis TaxID=2528011 RepID=A0A518BRE5_9BACT|nr:Phosphate regulon transcriptional regulatory protein PhoB [Planctomycetes bacterium Pla133]QDV03877.1 Phosphate regulon transcriptional regulatory protein PhoB [Planctomycetes bacterium Pla86]
MSKILIVEDDANINRALCIRLRAAGYEVISAEDGYLGLSVALQRRPDLMLLDISMPAGGGLSIVERLREHPDAPEIPFVVLTASKREEYRQEAATLGAGGYFEKPYRSEELVAEIQRVLALAASPAVNPAA